MNKKKEKVKTLFVQCSLVLDDYSWMSQWLEECYLFVDGSVKAMQCASAQSKAKRSGSAAAYGAEISLLQNFPTTQLVLCTPLQDLNA